MDDLILPGKILITSLTLGWSGTFDARKFALVVVCDG